MLAGVRRDFGRFNSTLVRSRPRAADRKPEPSNAFQFHIGSIKAPRQPSFRQQQYLVSIPHWFDQGRCHFDAKARARNRFNSTLVRSRRDETRGHVDHSLRFQFHIGSIKAGRLARFNPETISVSIPHWFDQGVRGERAAGRMRPVFQFHIGSIKAGQRPQGAADVDTFQFHIGSIKAQDRVRVERLEDRFNSTLVRSRRQLSRHSASPF